EIKDEFFESKDKNQDLDTKKDKKRQFNQISLQMSHLLWSDPRPILNSIPSKRGLGHFYGLSECLEFLDQTESRIIIRAHEYRPRMRDIVHEQVQNIILDEKKYFEESQNHAVHAILNLLIEKILKICLNDFSSTFYSCFSLSYTCFSSVDYDNEVNEAVFLVISDKTLAYRWYKMES
ncbi:Serine/threonine-protein phosphatase, partial [Pseudoloma neurophilia]